MKWVLLSFVRLGLLCVMLTPQVGAQVTATLVGQVLDPAGSGVPSALITLSNVATGFERTAETDGAGLFSLRNIPLQTYELHISASGFSEHREALSLRSNVPVERLVTLGISAQRETLEVTAVGHATLIDTEATGSRAELHLNVIEKLPLPPGARGIEAILLTMPGFAANANGAIHPRGAHNQMSYVIDGMPISDQFTGSFATSIDASLVQSLELFTGDVPAEYGSKVSGVASITTRSGFDGAGRTFGFLEIGAGGFDAANTALQIGGSKGRLGYFASASAVKSNRFLDSPSLDNLHNGGNSERAFTRLDYHLSDKDFLRASAMSGRSSFQLANLRLQHANGQQQRRLLRDAAISLGWVRLLSPTTTFDTTTSYRTTIAQLLPSAGDTPVTASLARHLSTFSTFNRWNVDNGKHRLRLGVDYQRFPVSENFFFGITDADFNHPTSDDFNPNLTPFDLTRNGDWFRFSDKGAGSLFTVFAQDRLRAGRFLFNIGARYDAYRFLVKGNQLQPRLGLAYRIDETGTVLRASYNRNYQTPPNENLLLANSAESGTLAPPDVRRSLNGGVILMRPQRQNVYEVGFEQRIAGIFGLSGAYYHKNSSDLQDNDNFLNTGVIFPTSLARSRVNGVEAKLTMPEWNGWSGSVGVTHYHAVVTPPFTGGLFLGSGAVDTLSAGPFIIDHDQPLSVASNVTWRPHRQWWTSLQTRYDSGLVSNPSDPADVALDPDYFDQLPYVNLTGNPPRVRPRTIVDAAVGYEYYSGDRRTWEVVAQISNLTDKTALYNFQSVFVGTRVVQPRSFSIKIRRHW